MPLILWDSRTRSSDAISSERTFEIGSSASSFVSCAVDIPNKNQLSGCERKCLGNPENENASFVSLFRLVEMPSIEISRGMRAVSASSPSCILRHMLVFHFSLYKSLRSGEGNGD